MRRPTGRASVARVTMSPVPEWAAMHTPIACDAPRPGSGDTNGRGALRNNPLQTMEEGVLCML